MRSVQVGADRRLATVTVDEPRPGPGQALIDVAHCGICGSDLHFRDVPELFPAGTVPGHELSGRIVAVGEGVEGWAVGARVCALPFGQCGECAGTPSSAQLGVELLRPFGQLMLVRSRRRSTCWPPAGSRPTS